MPFLGYKYHFVAFEKLLHFVSQPSTQLLFRCHAFLLLLLLLEHIIPICALMQPLTFVCDLMQPLAFISPTRAFHPCRSTYFEQSPFIASFYTRSFYSSCKGFFDFASICRFRFGPSYYIFHFNRLCFLFVH